MNTNVRIIAQIASIVGVVSVVFAALAAIVSYGGITAQYGTVPVSILQYSLFNSMIPYLFFAVLAFTVAGVISRSSRENVEPQEIKPVEAQPEVAPPP